MRAARRGRGKSGPDPSLYSVGFPPTRLLFAAKSSSTRSFIAVGEDSGTSSIVSGDGGKDLKLEALDLLQSMGWATGAGEHGRSGKMGRWCFCRACCPEAITQNALTRLPHGEAVLPPPTLHFVFTLG